MVPGICMARKELQELDRGCKFLGPTHGWVHDEQKQRSLVRFPVPEALFQPRAVHSGCMCNQIVGICNRVLGKVPKPLPQAVRECTHIVDKLTAGLKLTSKVDYEVVYAKYQGRKRTKYENAAEALRTIPLQRRDANLNTFIKSEKFDFHSKNNPDPRMIQFRNARHTLELMSYLRPMEHQLYNLRGNGKLLPTTRSIAKGLNPEQRGALLLEKWKRFNHPLVVSLDCSRWDKHVALECLDQVEHRFYRNLNSDPWLATLLRRQLRSFGYSGDGLRYFVSGRRCSGDANTALGNCLLMLVFVARAVSHLGLRRWDLLDDGDDCLLFLEWSDQKKLARVPALFKEVGQEVKIENITDEFEKIIFCQCQPVFVDGNPVMLRDPRKVVNKALTSTRHFDPKCAPRALTTIGYCELALARGVPIAQSFALSLCRIGARLMNLDNFKYYQAQKWYGELERIRPRPVSLPTRESYHRAFGMEVEEQLAIEREMDSCVFGFDGQYEAPEWISYPTHLQFVGNYTPPGNDRVCVTCNHAT